MKNFFKNPVVTLFIGILISSALSSLQNNFINDLLFKVPVIALITILFNISSQKSK